MLFIFSGETSVNIMKVGSMLSQRTQVLDHTKAPCLPPRHGPADDTKQRLINLYSIAPAHNRTDVMPVS